MTEVDNGCPLVLIEWEDSAQPTSGWQYLADFECGQAVQCASVGWLIEDGEKVKALAPNLGEVGTTESAQASGIIRIPARCITRVVRLEEAD